MGMMIDGKWDADATRLPDKDGRFVRKDSAYACAKNNVLSLGSSHRPTALVRFKDASLRCAPLAPPSAVRRGEAPLRLLESACARRAR